MVAIIGAIVVFSSIVSGYLMEEGNLYVLVQPAELIIIFGAAFGSFLISSPPRVIAAVAKNVSTIVKPKGKSKTDYLELLSLLYQIFSKIRKEGIIAIESDVEEPDKSPIFRKYNSVISNHDAVDYICDNLKVIMTTNVVPYELDNIMELEVDAHLREAMVPSHSVAQVADALPGLGIVAAVLGVVLTMGKMGEPPEVLGHSIGAALVGTFLGVLLCYGFVGPMATNLEHGANEDIIYFQVIKVAVVAFVGGAAPQIAVEFARRVIESKEKPGFNELEAALRK